MTSMFLRSHRGAATRVAAGLGAATLLMAVGAANAADLYRNPPPVAPVAAPTTIPAYAFNWSGFYVGANAGGRWLQDKGSTIGGGETYRNNSSSFVGGLQGGYNWQTGNVVLGAETDFDYGNNSKTSALAAGTVRTKMDWSGSVRGRLGYAIDRTLIYGTGGLSWANFNMRGVDNAGATASTSRSRAGWTVGAGLEYAFTDKISVRGEYLYSDFGSTNVSYTGTAIPSHRESLTSHLARVGVNYKF